MTKRPQKLHTIWVCEIRVTESIFDQNSIFCTCIFPKETQKTLFSSGGTLLPIALLSIQSLGLLEPAAAFSWPALGVFYDVQDRPSQTERTGTPLRYSIYTKAQHRLRRRKPYPLWTAQLTLSHPLTPPPHQQSCTT
jgi:hypothetical protein